MFLCIFLFYWLNVNYNAVCFCFFQNYCVTWPWYVIFLVFHVWAWEVWMVLFVIVLVVPCRHCAPLCHIRSYLCSHILSLRILTTTVLGWTTALVGGIIAISSSSWYHLPPTSWTYLGLAWFMCCTTASSWTRHMLRLRILYLAHCSHKEAGQMMKLRPGICFVSHCWVCFNLLDPLLPVWL